MAAPRRSTPPTPRRANWTNFGNTVDENRYSPLTQITPGNVYQLGRAFTFDLNKAVPGIKKGQQSYPDRRRRRSLRHLGRRPGLRGQRRDRRPALALRARQPRDLQELRHRRQPRRRLLRQPDLPADARHDDRRARPGDRQAARARPDRPCRPRCATPNYGYSETSAPICANHTVVLGAAGSDYGVRGFVMAYHTDLTPAWANPFWIIPPAGTEWRSAARLVGGATNWTPETVDPTTNTLYFGTAAASPAYYPSLRPGSDPRADSVVAVDLATGKLKWWQQQLASNEWGYDTSQPPLVYTAKIGGKSKRIVSMATMEGVWFAYDAATGAPIYQRVKVIDNVEHPALEPGQAGRRLPVLARRAQLLGGVVQTRRRTTSTTPRPRPRRRSSSRRLPRSRSSSCSLGNTFLGLANGDFGSYLQTGWRDYGSVSAIDVATGKRVWKFNTPEPERGGVTTTASGLGFVGGGDGNLRAFDAKSGSVLWKFQTGRQIAAGTDGLLGRTAPSTSRSRSAGRSPRRTAARSRASCRSSRSAAARRSRRPSRSRSRSPRRPRSASRRAPRAPCAPRLRAASGAARIVTPGGLTVQPWDPDTSNTTDVQGHLLLAGQPVAGAKVSVDGWVAPPTDKSGVFVYPADVTVPARHVVSVGGRGPREDRRQAAHRRPARGRAEGAGRDQRRLRDQQPLEPSGRGGDGRGHGPARQRQGPRAAARRSLQLRADGHGSPTRTARRSRAPS